MTCKILEQIDLDVLARFYGRNNPDQMVRFTAEQILVPAKVDGSHDGLGLIPGTVTRIPNTDASGRPHKLPQIGWASLQSPSNGGGWRGTALEDVAPESAVYFVHSFTARPKDSRNVLATYDYNGRSITAAIGDGSVLGCQFHPEKSGRVGLQILTRFLSL